jgi:hypothetical protein
MAESDAAGRHVELLLCLSHGTVDVIGSLLACLQTREISLMMNSRLTIAALLIAGLAGSPFAASAAMYKHTKHHTSSSMTTGTNMKSSRTKSMGGSNESSQGNVGPGTTNNNTTPPGNVPK